MQHQPIDVMVAADPRRGGGAWRDAILAVVLATILSACWAMGDWSDLSQLVLPDPDDMMRLAQVRDWLAGQATNDWTQYRMAPPLGAPMHWSRINDVGIAALILGLSPLFGRHGAELGAALGYPALLFALHLFMAARLARRMWGAEGAGIAIVLGALAYPGTTVFAPGRIDHHALQLILLEGAVLAQMGRASLRTGTATGACIALGLVVGLEAAPQMAAFLVVAVAIWATRGQAERSRLAGLALGIAATTAPFILFLRPTLWSGALCDAFTPASADGALAGAAALALLALATPMLQSRRARWTSGITLGGVVLAGLVAAYPACLTGPYGRVDPFLRREFIAHITEANGIFSQDSFGRGVQLAGLMIVSCLAVGWTAWRYPRRWPRWAPLAAVVAVSGAITLVQVRGTYIGEPIAAPLLAGVVLFARHRRPVVLAGAWLACTGIGWYALPLVVNSLMGRMAGVERSPVIPKTPVFLCRTGKTWAEVNRYPPGVVMAPTSIAAYLLGATRMSTVGAGYHRNDRGNMAMYRYFLGPPAGAREIARRWHVRYIAFCPGDFGEMDVASRFPRSLAAMLNAGRAPADFHALPLPGTQLRLYRIDP